MSILNLTRPVNEATASSVCLGCNAWFFSEKVDAFEAEKELTELIRAHARIHLLSSGIFKDRD